MARKPTHSKNKGPAKAQRQVKRHKAHHRAAHRGVLGVLGVLGRLWARAPKTMRVPGMDHDVDTLHVLAFVAVLGLAIGGGYGGAQALFGGAKEPSHASRTVIQQTALPHGVILPEPNGTAPSDVRAYEEKLAEEIYVADEPHLDTPPAEVANLPPVTDPATGQVPVGTPVGPQPLWMQNALDVPLPHDGPVIAIVIDDMGVDRKRSRHMWEDVPGPLTLSFMTYADDLPSQTQAAKERGHELMLHMSMEPSNAAIDPGPNVLMSAMDDQELKSIVSWGLDRFDGFVGVNNHMGSRFTEDPRAMRIVLDQVKAHGLLFLDSRTSAHSVGRRVARELGMAVLERNVFLDNDNDVDKVLHQLEQVERLARKQGFAIAIGHPRDATIEVLKTWVPEAIARGINIVPVSMLLKSRMRTAAAAGRG